jgi:hypothetical protein
MKKIFTLAVTAVLVLVVFVASTPGDRNSTDQRSTYVILGWNDLGMHCANKTFATLCILPPYNNQFSHVIRVGTESTLPQVLSGADGVHVTYEIPGNTYSVGKTDFWTYAPVLFGVNLPDNTGLTGLGLSGSMLDSANFFYAYGIPVTPYPDDNLAAESPFQLTLLKAYDAQDNLLATTQNTIPVSNEIGCVSSGCHSSEQNILNAHEQVPGFGPAPVFCADCHADPALGMPGNGSAPYFSQVIHQQHSFVSNCYKCHPGTNTQCLRGAMKIAGKTCTDCHGSTGNVGNTVENGRIPWVDEPKCSSCHDADHSENPNTLYKQSTGHGGLYCEACHNSTHAEVTSLQANDNLQNLTLQGMSGPLQKCEVCHGYIPAGPGPHGFNPLGIKPVSGNIPEVTGIQPNFPNPCSFMTNIPYTVKEGGRVTMDVLDVTGNRVAILMDADLKPGEYQAEWYTERNPSGIYLVRLQVNGTSSGRKILVVK